MQTPDLHGMSPEAFDQMMHAVMKEARRRKEAEEQSKYRSPDGIVRFVREVIGVQPAPYQERILRALVEHKRVAVRGPHGLGKTALASWVTLWGMYAFDEDVKIPTLASVWRQLEKFLWPEIRRWARKLDWSGSERPRILTMSMKYRDKEAFAISSDEPGMIEGAHASTLIYIFDESKIIPDALWDAAEGAFSGAGEDTAAEAYWLAVSTPGAPSGRFYDIHARKPGLQDWHVIHVTLEEAIEAGRISREWATKRAEQWGEQSAVYKNRVLGEFDESGEDSVIPLSWIEASNERWHACQGHGDGGLTVGVDPARYGRDKTAIARLVGRVLESLKYHSQEDTMQTTGRVTSQVDKQTPVAVDVIGIGAGVTDRLKELGYKVTGVNVAEAAQNSRGEPMKDKTNTFTFVNLRSFIWWTMRDALNPDNPDALALPPDDRLTGDLAAPMYTYTSKGQIKVESKDEIRKRIGRSTDAGDALGLAYYLSPLRPGTASNRIEHRIGKAVYDHGRDRFLEQYLKSIH